MQRRRGKTQLFHGAAAGRLFVPQLLLQLLQKIGTNLTTPGPLRHPVLVPDRVQWEQKLPHLVVIATLWEREKNGTRQTDATVRRSKSGAKPGA